MDLLGPLVLCSFFHGIPNNACNTHLEKTPNLVGHRKTGQHQVTKSPSHRKDPIMFKNHIFKDNCLAGNP